MNGTSKFQRIIFNVERRKVLTENKLVRQEHISISKVLPVIILDLDNTIIGNIIEVELKQKISVFDILITKINSKDILNSNVFENKSFNKINRYFRKLLKEGLLRPYFNIFIDFVKKHKINVFIYTAATPLWAKFMIFNIEKLIRFKFNRPIFTRDDMVIKNEDYYKSINYIKPKILKNLIISCNSRNSKIKIMMIDNKDDVILEKKYIYKCKDYEYTSIININNILTNKNLKQILGINNKNLLDKFMKYYNYKIAKLILQKKYMSQENNKFDTFWKDIIIIIKNKYYL